MERPVIASALRFLGCVCLSTALLTAPDIARADLTYDVNIAAGGETITGSVSVNCATLPCILDGSNVTAWNFVGTGPTPLSISGTGANVALEAGVPSDLEAFPTELVALQNNPGGGILAFQENNPLLSEVGFNDEGPGGIEVTAQNLNIPSTTTPFIGSATDQLNLVPIGTLAVPEPGTLVILGVALLAGGLVRRRPKIQDSCGKGSA